MDRESRKYLKRPATLIPKNAVSRPHLIPVSVGIERNVLSTATITAATISTTGGHTHALICDILMVVKMTGPNTATPRIILLIFPWSSAG